jgi:alpha-L-fucosidase
VHVYAKQEWKMKKHQNLTELEKEVYDFVKARGEVLTTNIPTRMRGSIPNLRDKGLIEVYKKITSERRMKKRKFLRIKEPLEGEEPVESYARAIKASTTSITY